MKLKNNIKNTMLSLAVLLSTSSVFAVENIGGTAEALGEQVGAVTNLMIIGATLLGIVFLIVGGLNLKKHGDNPQQVPLSKPLIFLTAGALLFGLGSTSDVMQSTLFGGGREADSSGSQFNDFAS